MVIKFGTTYYKYDVLRESDDLEHVIGETPAYEEPDAGSLLSQALVKIVIKRFEYHFSCTISR